MGQLNNTKNTKMVDANSVEATLKNQQWVGGQSPTDADKAAFEALATANLSPESHPFAFAWFCLVSKFSDAVRNSWAAPAAAAGKKKKKVVIAMSIVMLEVKPLDDTTNLDDLAAHIFANITMDGLFWKTEYKKEPVAYGIFKLIVGFSLEDEKVSVDTVVEKIEEFEDRVQSVEIAVFNKI